MEAGEARRRRMAAVRAREAVVEKTVIDVIAAKLAIVEAEHTLVGGVRRLKELGETQETIAELCTMSASEVKTALAAAKTEEAGSAGAGGGGTRATALQRKDAADV
jgi:hypothetical protein